MIIPNPKIVFDELNYTLNYIFDNNINGLKILTINRALTMNYFKGCPQ